MTKFPPVEDLPEIDNLPDPFLMKNGKRVRTLEEWKDHRKYLKAVLFHYFYGQIPPKPEEFRFVQTSSAEYKKIGVEERYDLILSRNDQNIAVRVALIRPREKRRYPVVIRNFKNVTFDNIEGSDDGFAADEALKRGYIFCKFMRLDVWPDMVNAREGIFQLYPEYTWGAIAAWAWTYQVIIDALDQLEYIDVDKIVATGHSRGGQTAVAAGIIDERIGIVAPCTGGFWSVGTARQRDPNGVRGTADVVEIIKRQCAHWYSSRYYEFVGRQNQLPWDGHTLAALIAPRPFLNTSSEHDECNNPLSMEAGVRAARIVYEWMGVGDRIRLHMRKQGGHGQLTEEYKALFDFADEHFFGKKNSTSYNEWIFPKEPLHLDWQAPRLIG
jgi:hypothetical protein